MELDCLASCVQNNMVNIADYFFFLLPQINPLMSKYVPVKMASIMLQEKNFLGGVIVPLCWSLSSEESLGIIENRYNQGNIRKRLRMSSNILLK